MKLKLLLILIFLSTLLHSQNEFITIWKPSNIQTGNSVTAPFQTSDKQIWFPGIGNNYNIYWEEVGHAAHNGTLANVSSTENVLIDFGQPFNPNPSAALYKVKVINGSGKFDRIAFYNKSTSNQIGIYGDTRKILEVSQWGNIIWTSMEDAFSGCIYLDVSATDIPNLTNVLSMSNMFSGCNNLLGNSTMANWDISNVTSLHGTFGACFLFNQPIGSWNTSNVTNMALTFFGTKEFNQPLANWDTSNVLFMNAMFSNALKFNQPIGNWNVHNVLETELMFASAKAFNQPLNNWNTSNVFDFQHMFRGATAFNQPLNLWDTSSAIHMNGMFWNATSFNQDITTWNTSNVMHMDNMFNNTPHFNQNIGNWNTSSLVTMNGMFQNAVSFNQNIGNWNTSSVTTMQNAFNGATAFNQNLEQWNLLSLTNAQNMLQNSGLNCYHYDNTIYGWRNNANTPNNINLGNVAPLVYSHTLAEDARNYLINTKNWTISGDTLNRSCNKLLGTSEINGLQQIQIYPNPASEFLFITSRYNIISCNVYDASGRLVLKSKNLADKLHVGHLKNGVYFIEITTNVSTKKLKFIKK